jgi:hypothetical protein
LALSLHNTTVPQTATFVNVHATLLDGGLWPDCNDKGQTKGQLAIQLYYLARALDPAGSGSAVIDLVEAAKILEISIYSVRRRMQWAFNHGLFRAKLRIGTQKIKVYYTALQHICVRLNIADIGACTEIEISQLRNLKFAATEATALQLQNRSRWSESNRKKCDRRKTLDPQQMTTSELGAGAILFKKGRVTFLKRSHTAYGGSQKRLAWELGRHPSTIQRRLSDGYRAKHGLDPIPKTQLAVSPKVTLSRPTSKGAITKLALGQNIIYIPGYGRFRLATNVYDINLTLKPKRRTRHKIKRAFLKEENRLLISDDWKLDPEYQALKSAWKASLINKDSLLTENFARGLRPLDFQ